MILAFSVFGISVPSRAKTDQQQCVLKINSVTIANQSNKLFTKIESSSGMCAKICSSPCFFQSGLNDKQIIVVMDFRRAC